jgi:hypothetical protein
LDNTKYKSVAISKDVHKDLKNLAHREGRTIGGQMAHIVKAYTKPASFDDFAKEAIDFATDPK